MKKRTEVSIARQIITIFKRGGYSPLETIEALSRIIGVVAQYLKEKGEL